MKILSQTILFFSIAFLGCNQDSGTEHRNVSIDWSPDGTTVVFSSADGDLYLFHLDAQSVTRLTSTKAIESVPCFSPDGKSIVYAQAEDAASANSIHLLHLPDLACTQLTEPVAQSDSLPRFSPDGKKIVFGRAYRNRPYGSGGTIWDNWDLCEMDANGKNVKRLTDENYYQLYRMVPKTDGSIVYSAGPKATLYTLEKDKQPRRITPDPQDPTSKVNAWASDVMVSPDESKITFTADQTRPFWYDVCLSDDGTNPTFSPDGQRIIFLAGTKFGDGNRAIYSLWEVSTAGVCREIASDDLFTAPQDYPAAANKK